MAKPDRQPRARAANGKRVEATMGETRAPTNDIWEAMYTQRAIRRWTQQPVPDAVLWRVVEAATRAPSGSNLQPWRFIVVRDPARRSAIARALRARFEANAALKTYVERGAVSANRTERLMLSGAKGLFLALDQAPVVVVPCLYQVASPAPEGVLAGSSIYGAVQNLLLAARALGLGTVMTTLHAAIEPQLRELLELPGDALPVALIPLGFPDANFGVTNRQPVADVTYWETWGASATRPELAGPGDSL